MFVQSDLLYTTLPTTCYPNTIMFLCPLSPASSAAGRGYLEDRRPSSNSDPYLVCEALARTAILDDWSDFNWTDIPSRP